MTKKYLAGEIIYVHLGNPPNEVQGHEQGKYRPCVIVNAFNSMKLAVIVPITSTKPNYETYTQVNLPSGTSGLTKDSYVLCHHIRSISFDRIDRSIGVLDTSNFFKICSVLKTVIRV